jgi:hypothetical protein
MFFPGPTVPHVETTMTAGLLAPDTRLAFPIANQWPLRRGFVRYSRGGGTGITPASRFTLSGTVIPICVRTLGGDQYDGRRFAAWGGRTICYRAAP